MSHEGNDGPGKPGSAGPQPASAGKPTQRTTTLVGQPVPDRGGTVIAPAPTAPPGSQQHPSPGSYSMHPGPTEEAMRRPTRTPAGAPAQSPYPSSGQTLPQQPIGSAPTLPGGRTRIVPPPPPPPQPFLRPPPAPPQSLDSEVDAAFTNAAHSGAAPAGDGELATDEATQAEIQRLFGQIAAHHSAQIRDFVLELSHGDTTRQWAELCAPAVVSLKRAAATIRHRGLVAALEAFERGLRGALRANAPMISGEYRRSLLLAYDGLKQALPGAFDVRSDRDRREPIIIDSLLRQVSGVHALVINRLYEAGVTTLAAFYKARPADLVATAGIEESVATAICEAFAAHKRDRAELAPEKGRKSERTELRSILEALSQSERDYKEAEEEDDRRRKREIRQQRTTLVRRLDLLLAQLGEVDLVNELKRIPVARKIKRVDRYLRQPLPT